MGTYCVNCKHYYLSMNNISTCQNRQIERLIIKPHYRCVFFELNPQYIISTSEINSIKKD